MKPDQLIKRRGKLGLIKVNVDLQQAKQWIKERMGKEIQASKLQGCVLHMWFLINPIEYCPINHSYVVWLRDKLHEKLTLSPDPTAINLLSNCVYMYSAVLLHTNSCTCFFNGQIGAATGLLKRFIVEPFVPHQQVSEFHVYFSN